MRQWHIDKHPGDRQFRRGLLRGRRPPPWPPATTRTPSSPRRGSGRAERPLLLLPSHAPVLPEQSDSSYEHERARAMFVIMTLGRYHVRKS